MSAEIGEHTPSVVQLVEAAGDAIPAGAYVVVPQEPVVAEREVPWTFVALGSAALDSVVDPGRPRDSAAAIVALERIRTRGASFFALPALANSWFDELVVFADHCRDRYPLVLRSELGAIFDLRAEAKSGEMGAKPDPPEADGCGRGDEDFDPREETRERLDGIDVLAAALSRLVRSGSYSAEEFRCFERHGVHVTPVHFYSPIPDTSQLNDDIWQQESGLFGIDMNDEEQLHLLSRIFPQFRAEYEALPNSPPEGDASQFYLGNGLFDGMDALVLYCMLRYLRPRRVIEVGSGFSTRLAAQAALANGSTELLCVDPFPDPVLQEGIPGLTTLIASRVEELPLDLFLDITENDVLFIDSSHVARTGGDVTFLFLEVLPRLQPGVVVQVHDIFLPFEYRRDWVVDALRFWNEQYILQAFLAFNSAFRVLLANSYLHAHYSDVLRSTFPTSPWWGGGSFWFQRRPDSP